MQGQAFLEQARRKMKVFAPSRRMHTVLNSTKAIERDARDPQFMANLSKLGQVRVDHHMQTVRPVSAYSMSVYHICPEWSCYRDRTQNAFRASSRLACGLKSRRAQRGQRITSSSPALCRTCCKSASP